MTQIHAYISFNGHCREAMTFYKECLGGDLTFQTIAETPMAAQCPEEMQHQIMHSYLAKGDLLLMASDMVSMEGFIQGNHMALSLNCSSKEEITTFYASLSAGGKIIDPLKEQFWGDLFGVIQDKFGIRWMLNCSTN